MTRISDDDLCFLREQCDRLEERFSTNKVMTDKYLCFLQQRCQELEEQRSQCFEKVKDLDKQLHSLRDEIRIEQCAACVRKRGQHSLADDGSLAAKCVYCPFQTLASAQLPRQM